MFWSAVPKGRSVLEHILPGSQLYSVPMTGEVSPLDSGDEAAARSRLRASHQDRDHVAEQLRVAAGDGRLTAEELDHRLGIALTARTHAELAALMADLPGGSDQRPDATARGLTGVARIDSGSGSIKRTGRWVVPQRLEVRVASGKVVLDFTEAVVTHPAIQIDAGVRSGSLVIVTKPGIVVDATAIAVGSGEVKVRAPWGPQVPVALRIEVSGEVTSGNITARPPRRTFRQWLRRMRQHLADR
jgi:uncharacterized protein DUF1707